MTHPSPIPVLSNDEDEDTEEVMACVLVFNASDPSGAGGLSCDTLAIASVGAHALPVVTGAYARDTREILDFLSSAKRPWPTRPAPSLKTCRLK